METGRHGSAQRLRRSALAAGAQIILGDVVEWFCGTISH